MADRSDDVFYDTIIETSLHESDDDAKILVVVVLLDHDHGNHVQ
jgi:hypothetical protein